MEDFTYLIYRLNEHAYDDQLWLLREDCLSFHNCPLAWDKAIQHGGENLHAVIFWFFEFAR